jgi:hypothetical protein
MRQRDKQAPQSTEEAVRDIRRATRRHFSAEERIRIVVEGLRGEDSIAELCRKEGIAPARSGSPVTPHARRPPMKSRRSVPKPVSSRRRWPRSPSRTAC